MFESYQKIDDVTLYYKVYGSELEAFKKVKKTQLTLIFLHGGPGVVDHTLYELFWSKFTNTEIDGSKLQVIFIDHRGNGRSYEMKNEHRDYGDKSKWDLEQWGKDVHDFFKSLGIVKLIVAGVSFGGVVAMSCATQFPEELGGLILCDTDARFDLDLIVEQFAKKVREKNDTDKDVNKVCAAVRDMFMSTTKETYQAYVDICLPYCAAKPYSPEFIAKCIKNEAVAYHYNKNELTKYNFIPQLSLIKSPVLVLCGDQNPVHNVESARKTAAAINKELLTFKLFENAGSPVYADRHDDVFLEIEGFIKKVK